MDSLGSRSKVGPFDRNTRDARKLSVLQRCHLSEGLGAEELEDIAARARSVEFPPVSKLFTAEQPATRIYALGSGHIKLFLPISARREVVVELICPGHLCGWISVLSNDLYLHTARAADEVYALAWEKADFEQLLVSIPRLSRNVVDLLARRVCEQQQRYLQLATETAPQRVARTLLQLSKSSDTQVETASDGVIPLSRAELAQLTGTSLFTVSRFLSLWDDQALVRARRGRVVIKRPRGLGRIAEPRTSSRNSKLRLD